MSGPLWGGEVSFAAWAWLIRFSVNQIRLGWAGGCSVESGQAALAHPSGFRMRMVEAGSSASMAGGRIGRGTRTPLQFGQMLPSLVSAQSAQKVHS